MKPGNAFRTAMDCLVRSCERYLENAPSSESAEASLDFLRALAILAVVFGHWLMAAVWIDDAGQHTANRLVPFRRAAWTAKTDPAYERKGSSMGERRSGDSERWRCRACFLSHCACVLRGRRPNELERISKSAFEQVVVTVELDSRFEPGFLSSSLWFRL